MNYNLATATYENGSFLKERVSQGWNSSTNSWDNAYRNVSSYNSSNQLIFAVLESWQNNVWVQNSSALTYHYDSNGMLDSLLEKYSPTSENISLETYQYNADGSLKQTFRQRWVDNIWSNSYKKRFTYNSDKLIIGAFQESWDSNTSTWISRDSQRYEYNSAKQLTVQYFLKWNKSTSNWLYNMRFILDYDDNGWNTLSTVQFWDGNEWDNSSQSISSYTDACILPSQLPSVSIKKDISVTEGNTSVTPAKFTISLNKTTASTVTVNYTTKSLSAKAGSDFTAKTGKLTFGNGFVNKSITIDVTGDNLVEPNERFALVLSNPVNAVLGTIDSAICIIKNDDPSFSWSNSIQNDISTSEKSVKIYPNPVKDVLNIQGLNEQDKVQLSIVDVNGKVLIQKNVNTSSYQWNIKTLPAGSYFLQIEKQNKIYTYPFIKQ